MSAVLRPGRLALAALVFGGSLAGAPVASAATTADAVRTAAVQGTLGAGVDPAAPDDGADDGTASGRAHYPGNPGTESGLVAAEDRRLTEVRTVGILGRWTSTRVFSPYRLAAGSAYSLVLTPRRAPYTIKDLLVLAPQTFVRQPDGAYLLSEDIVISNGASLTLSSAGPLTLRMASDAKGFVSIVNDGGRLQVSGTPGAPVTITSWDRARGAVDQDTADGRAYLRSIGGQVTLSHVSLHDLGFWSGRTGGLALTGTDRPNTGALDALGRSLQSMSKHERPAGSSVAEPNTPGVVNGLLPAGNLPVPDLSLLDPRYSYASASLSDVTATANAFGLFVANANGVEIRSSSFRDSLVDGIVFHRYVRNTVVDKTSSTGNGGDGIILSRATTGIVLSEAEASYNARNGVTVSGLPLAIGPSATGTPVESYGNNSVNNSTMTGNRHYGIEVIGGTNIGINGNDLVGNDMGVVVRDGAAKVSVVGNDLRHPVRQGIALRDRVTDAVVSGNIVTGGEIGVYLRDTTGAVSRNTLRDASGHGITVVGSAGGLTVSDNTITGRGPSAIDAQRADGLDRVQRLNNLGGWVDTTPWLVTLKRYLQPMTLLWLVLGLTLVLTAVRGLRRQRRFVHPYADKRPVTGPDAVADPVGRGATGAVVPS